MFGWWPNVYTQLTTWKDPARLAGMGQQILSRLIVAGNRDGFQRTEHLELICDIVIPRETEGYWVELVRLSVCPSVCLSVRLSVCLSVPLDIG